jgi:hypothetical protein
VVAERLARVPGARPDLGLPGMAGTLSPISDSN